MQQVITLAQFRGWRAYHTHDARRSAAGWPDLALCRPPRLLLVETKTEQGVVSAAQRGWLDALAACPGVEVYTWRPSDWARVEAVLA